MQYRRFGRTELQMPVFSCGGMRYQQSWDDMPLADVNPENQANLEATIRCSVELGINHIETARGYGSSERQLGVVLPTFPRDELIVQTKIAPEADPTLFEKNFHESLERLQLDYVDLLGLHGINTHEILWNSVRPGGCLEVARRLQAEGKVRHIGFSTHGSLPLILDALREDRHGGFDYVNLHWYFIFQHNWPAVELATQRDMGVFIISPSAKGGNLFNPPPKLVDLCKPLHPLVFNTLFCLNQPEVHTLSLGASCPSDFDLQLESLPLVNQAEELIDPILDRLFDASIETNGEEYDHNWQTGLPDWEDAPNYMNIKSMLWLRSLVRSYDMLDYAKMRYNLLGNGGHWFPGLNAANLADISDEKFNKAVKDSPFAKDIRGWLMETHDLLGGGEVKRESESD